MNIMVLENMIQTVKKYWYIIFYGCNNHKMELVYTPRLNYKQKWKVYQCINCGHNELSIEK